MSSHQRSAQYRVFAGGAFWNEDEQIIYSDPTLGLFRVSASGGVPEFLTQPDLEKGEYNLINPQPLPGGDVLLITMRTMNGQRFRHTSPRNR